jgi:hypothetical protein
MLTSKGWPIPMGFGLKLKWASVSNTFSTGAPVGCGPGIALPDPPGAPPCERSSLDIALAGIVISAKTAIRRIKMIMFAFAISFNKCNFQLSFQFIAKLRKSFAKIRYISNILFKLCSMKSTTFETQN